MLPSRSFLPRGLALAAAAAVGLLAVHGPAYAAHLSLSTHAAQAMPGRAAPANVLVARGRTEPMIVADPRPGHGLYAAANPDYYHPSTGINATALVSNDGAAWQVASIPSYGNFTGIADPSLSVDPSGRVYYLYMGETPSFCGEEGNAALLLARSDDGGRSYGTPALVDQARSDDKPFVTTATSHGRTTVYAVFTRWNSPYRAIMFTRSTDGGRSFAPPRELYASPGVNMGAVPVVDPRGRVYVVWAHYDGLGFNTPQHVRIMVRASGDGGRTFTASPVTIGDFTGLPRLLQPGALRLFTFPTVGLNPRSGTLYVAWIRARTLATPRYQGQMGADLVLVRSRDGGRTWSRPVVLNDSPAGDRFMPALSVGPDGVVRIAFYDRRADGLSFALDGVAVRDLRETLRVWPNRRISTGQSSPLLFHYIAPGSTCVAPGRFMGDYIGAATGRDGSFDVMWTDTRLGVQDESDLEFARVPPRYLQSGTPRIVAW